MSMSRGDAAYRMPHDGMNGSTFERIATMLSRWRYPLLALVALAQAAVLVSMVMGRESLLASGRQIDLKVVPVDPRDFFRGDYVTLAYDISQVPRTLIIGDLQRNEKIYVRLAQDATGTWQPAAVGRTRDEAGGAAGTVLIAGRVRYATRPVAESASERVWVTYGIEKFFVPEGSGREIENDVRNKQVVAHIAVARDGTAAIKGLTVDGTRIDMSPLF